MCETSPGPRYGTNSRSTSDRKKVVWVWVKLNHGSVKTLDGQLQLSDQSQEKRLEDIRHMHTDDDDRTHSCKNKITKYIQYKNKYDPELDVKTTQSELHYNFHL